MDEIKRLQERIRELERENKLLHAKPFHLVEGNTVAVPPQFAPIFDNAQEIVRRYFTGLKTDPTKGTIEISDQRYILIRASALSYDFFKTVQSLYADRGESEAVQIGRNFLFDIAHVIGMQDARSFIKRMKVDDPIAKLSTGPVHFAYSGWAFVDINPQSAPSPDENYFLKYTHPYSFEADSWLRSGEKTNFPVCIMNAGYSSGWCEESFGIELTAVEISCRAKGDKECEFIMAPPHRIDEYLSRECQHKNHVRRRNRYDIPTFFQRKKVEEEMRLARKKAEESDRAKSEFLANMSHEIRTPLNAILGYIDLILKDNVNKKHRGYLNIIYDSGKVLQSIVDDILDLSRIESGQLVLEKVPISIKNLFKNIEATGISLLGNKQNKLQLVKKIDTQLENTYIASDPTRLQQILLNLLSNAVKFTEEGFIEIGLKLLDENILQFYVKDTGIGIPKDKHDSIFESFSQADSSTVRKYGGSGLGLTITKKLVQLLGGEITLESKVGEGSTFYFTMPYLVAKQPKIKKISKTTVTESLKRSKLNVLLVDDNLVNLKLVKRMLEKAGHHVHEAEDGQKAFDIFCKSEPFDLVLMDMQMPILDGLATTRLMRKWEKEHQRPVSTIIALTANALSDERRKCLEAGCDDYLTKPIEYNRLLTTVQSHF